MEDINNMEPIFIKQERDKWGRMQYYYKCNICGREYAYALRRKNVHPICWSCNQKVQQRKSKQRMFAKAKLEIIRRIRQEYAQMAERCPYEFDYEDIVDVLDMIEDEIIDKHISGKESE